MNRDYPNYNIIEVDQNTEESSGDMRRLAVTQPPVKDHLLTLVWETRKKCFAIPVDHRVKIKESVKTGKYLDLAREMKKLRKMEVTVIPIVADAVGTGV